MWFSYFVQGARAASRNLSSKLHKLDQESLKQQEIIYMQVRITVRANCCQPFILSIYVTTRIPF